MPVRWLPANYDGPRSVADAAADLRAIARWPVTNQAHVTVRTANGHERRWTGAVSVADTDNEPGTLCLRVDDEQVFLLRPDEFNSARLVTQEGADYYAPSSRPRARRSKSPTPTTACSRSSALPPPRDH